MAYLTDDSIRAMSRGLSRHGDEKEAKKARKELYKEQFRALCGAAGGSLVFSYLDGAVAADGIQWKVAPHLPVSLLGAVGLHGLGLLAGEGPRWARKFADDLHQAANGAAAYTVGHYGRELGQRFRLRPHHTTGGMYGAGALPAPGQRYVVTDMPGVPAYGG